MRGQTSCAEYFFEETEEPFIDAVDRHGRCAIHIAAANGHEEFVKVLLGEGCAVDILDAQERTALMCAAEKGHDKVMSTLLDGGATCNKQDRAGNNVFHLAVRTDAGVACEELWKNVTAQLANQQNSEGLT